MLTCWFSGANPSTLDKLVFWCKSVNLGGRMSLLSRPVRLADYSHVDVLGVWYKSVSFGAEEILDLPDLVSPNRPRQM